MTLIEKVAKVLQSQITQEDLRLHQLNECCKLCLVCKGKKWVSKKVSSGFKGSYK